MLTFLAGGSEYLRQEGEILQMVSVQKSSLNHVETCLGCSVII